MSATQVLAQPAEVPRDRFEQEVLQHKGQVLVELWRPGAATRFFTEALVEQARRHPEVKLVRINVDEYRDLIEEYHSRRAINQTYDLSHVPGVALFRNGKLITTMKPIILNSDPALIAYNVRRQLDVFLAKFVEDVKTSVSTDESDSPATGQQAAGAADDKDAKIKAALEKAAKIKAERAKQKAAAAKAGGGAGDGAGAGAGTAGKQVAAAAAPQTKTAGGAGESGAAKAGDGSQEKAAAAEPGGKAAGPAVGTPAQPRAAAEQGTSPAPAGGDEGDGGKKEADMES
ncbi:MAG TPA: thioredoxin family protein [Thermaerobacter sp.]